MRAAARVAVLAALMALATWLLGWWPIPVLAVAWTLVFPRRARTPREAAVAALVAWLVLLLIDAARGPLMPLAHRLGVLFHTGAVALLVITLVLPLALAWSTSVIVRAALEATGRGQPVDETVRVDERAAERRAGGM